MTTRLRSALLLVIALTACASGNTASQLATPPQYAPKDQTKCSIEKSQAKPLVVDWPSTDRGDLETHARNHGVVVVHYQGCEMRVLDRCSVPVQYQYAGMNRKRDRVAIHDADELYANVPVGAASLEADLRRSGELDVEMALVGRWESAKNQVLSTDLQGDCDGATHVVYALTVGAFTFTAGADATVGGGASVMGAGGKAESTASRKTLSEDGVLTACEKSLPTDGTPPDNCSAVIRLEVVPLGNGTPAVLRQLRDARLKEFQTLLRDTKLSERATQCPGYRERALASDPDVPVDLFPRNLARGRQYVEDCIAETLRVPVDDGSAEGMKQASAMLDELLGKFRNALAMISPYFLKVQYYMAFKVALDEDHPCGQ